MNVGYKLLLIGLIISFSVFILSSEYPNIITGEIEGIIAIGSLIIIMIGGIITFKSRPVQNICQNCGQKLV